MRRKRQSKEENIMGMRDAIQNFHTQFGYEPKIEQRERLEKFDKFVVVGMGGSHLAADLLKIWNPSLQITIHSDYGLPFLPAEDLLKTLVIISSYSGNTEESLDAFHTAIEKQFPLFVISVGGALLELAKKYSIPYVQMPDFDIQPRSALGLSFKALLRVMDEEQALEEVSLLAHSLDPNSFEDEGKMLAERLRGKIPLIYASARNFPLAYNWKVKFNETGKIPAFANSLPEANHNEMTGFDVKKSTRSLSANFYCILLKDDRDDARIQKRMTFLGKLYKNRGLPVETIAFKGDSIFYRMFSLLLLADWAAYYTAEAYGVDSEQVPMVEEFKKLMAT